MAYRKVKPFLDKDVLRHLYVDEELAINKIAQRLNVSVGAVFNYLKMYGIETRKFLTNKQKKAISESNRGRVSPLKGKHLSNETKAKIAQAHKLKGMGHKKIRGDGYVAIYYPDYPSSNKNGYVMEHVYVMEQHIGRLLNEDEVVHHKNHIRSDNDINNLQLMTFKEHASLHMKERWAHKKGEMTYQ